MTISEIVDAPTNEELVGTAITASGTVAASPVRIPKTRYTSPEFAALEEERLWPRVWQIACTVDHVPEPGDFFEYRAGRLSLLIVRDGAGGLRAFQNVCLHRGNSLCVGSGSGLSELRCPYHRWCWDLEGRLREVPSRRGFGIVRNEEYGLVPAQIGVWGRLIFVNPDPDAGSLEEFLEGVPEDSAWAGVDDFRCVLTTTTPVACNWKVVSDGFSETYHVQGLHREMLGSIDEVDAPQRIWDRQSVSYQRYGVPSPRLGRTVSDQAVWDSFVLTQGGRMGPAYAQPCPLPVVPAGSTIRDVIAHNIRAHQARLGVDLSGLDTDAFLRLSQYNLFPNATVLVWGEMINVLIGRPGLTPDDGQFVSFLLHRPPAGAAPARPVDVPVSSDADFGLVIGQDVSMMARMQRGLHQPGLTHLSLSSEECRIINLHRNLERYLGLEPTSA